MSDSEVIQEIAGHCHCGNVSFSFSRHATAGPIRLRACGCDFCQKHRGRWTSDPMGQLHVTVRKGADLERYRFGTGTADFLVCRRCGVVPAVISEIEGRLYAVVSGNCFENKETLEISEEPSDFDGESAEGRLDRRAQNWIADVTLTIEDA